MANSQSKSEAQILENHRVALENVETQAEIAASLAEFGYDSTIVANGKQLYELARQAFDSNKTEDQETTVAYDAFEQKMEKIHDYYVKLRKKIRIIFRHEPVALKNLGTTGSIPRPYVQEVEAIRKTLLALQNDDAALQRLAPLKVTAEEITGVLTDLEQLDTLRADYLREVGESQHATKIKDKALGNLDSWMRDLLDVARIALEDKPQLLESLNLIVRN